jgi:hypothetical protein
LKNSKKDGDIFINSENRYEFGRMKSIGSIDMFYDLKKLVIPSAEQVPFCIMPYYASKRAKRRANPLGLFT